VPGTPLNLDLSVRFKKEFLLGDLLYHSSQAMMELLALANAPELMVEIEEDDKRVQLEGEFLCGTQCPILFIAFKHQAPKIKMIIYEIDPSLAFLPEEEKGLRAGILAGDGEEQWGDPLQIALAAGVAIALARIEGSKIRDYQSSLGSSDFQTAGELIQSLRVFSGFKDIQKAAQALFEKTPLALMIGPRLKSIQLEEEMDKLMVEMLGLIKISKRVDIAVFTRFYRVLDGMVEATDNDPGPRRNLIGFLCLIYEYLLEELRYAQDPEGFQSEIQRMKGKISKLGFQLPA
jgi:hypothetical protein